MRGVQGDEADVQMLGCRLVLLRLGLVDSRRQKESAGEMR